MRRILITILIMFPLLLSAQTLKGRAVRIADGDTFTLLVNGNEQVTIRIDGIDAPEKKQDFGNRAKQYLSDMIWNKELIVKFSKKDRYGRSIGKVSTPEIQDVGLEMIKAGVLLSGCYRHRDT